MTAYPYRLPRRYRYRARRKGGKLTREQAIALAVVLIAAGAGTKAAAVTAHHAARPATVAASRDGAASVAIAYARAQLGRPYLWGGTGPDAFDCSGLAMMAYRSAGVTIARTSQDQWATERHVPASQVQPGDLVFFAGSDGTMTDPGHVGIVIGGGKMIQALGTGYPIMVSSWHRPDLVGFTDPAGLAITTTAVRDPAPAGGTLYCSGLEALWTSAGGSRAVAFTAAEVAMAESGGRQYASLHNTNGTTDRGYWQVNSVHGSLSTFAALANARAAVLLSSDGTDWTPWTTYNSGAYLGKC
jgi:cell wall-associated NlpC family hydrolase